MIDSHSHLWFDHFDSDRDQVVQRARDAGVKAMIQVGCDEKSSRQSVALAEQYEDLYATVGLHPNDHQSWNDGKALDWMRELLNSSEKIIGIGETGIDYYRSSEQADLQKEMFEGQCRLAQEFDLPVVIHMRMTKRPEKNESGLNSVEQDVLDVLEAFSLEKDKIIFHCYSGGLEMAEEIVKKGWIFSFSGVLTYPNNGELLEVAKMVPEEQLFVETDCPFLTPQKYRGQRNEPAYVMETAFVLAQTRGVSLQYLEEVMDENVKRVFRI